MKNLSIALLAATTVGATLAGCGTSATLMIRNGVQIHGKIVGADAQDIYLQTAGGSARPIPKDEVTDIDHPGNVAAAIGSLLSAYGVVNIIVVAPGCDRESLAFCVGVGLPLAVGLPTAFWGFANWGGLNNALRHYYGPSTGGIDWNIIPQLELGEDKTTAGAAVVGRF